MNVQVLRTIDKFDRIGKEGVIKLLQKPEADFGANCDTVQAGLIVLFLDCKGNDNNETTKNIVEFFSHANKVKNRILLMVALDAFVLQDGSTSWDKLLAMQINEDETWANSGRPNNIGWALDDIIVALAKGSA